MKSAVNQLLDVDKEARQMLEEAQQYYDRTLLEIQEEKKLLLETYTKKSQDHVNNLEEQLRQDIEGVVQTVEERTKTLLTAMESRFEEHRDAWEEELFRRVVGRS